MKNRQSVIVAGLIALIYLPTTVGAQATSTDPQTSRYASDNDSLLGDHLKFYTNVGNITSTDESDKKEYCSPAGAKIAISSEDETYYYARFITVPSESDYLRDDLSLSACKDNRVNEFTLYKIRKSSIKNYSYKRTGVSFGGLLIPFKFRLGGAKELASSSTIAPYIGFRTGWLQSYGLTFTPIVAAGLSMIPISDTTNGTTETKAGYTFAVGLKLTSSKNENYSAGIIYGKDFLNKSDREKEPNATKPWISIYLGYSM